MAVMIIVGRVILAGMVEMAPRAEQNSGRPRFHTLLMSKVFSHLVPSRVLKTFGLVRYGARHAGC